MNTKGFTLVELIIVVAIIAILAAILIPTYQHYVNKSRESTCEANRKELARALCIAYQLDGKSGFDETLTEYDLDGICPSYGQVSATLDEAAGDVTITCSKHKDVDLVTEWTPETVADVLSALGSITTDGRNVSDADSGAIGNVVGSRSEAIVAALAEKNIDLNALGATSWHYDSSSKQFYWTSVDISTLTPGTGTKIPTLRYNAVTGTYTVFYCTVKATTLEGATYNILSSPTPYTPSTTSGKENQTLENAQQHFENAMNIYNGYTSK